MTFYILNGIWRIFRKSSNFFLSGLHTNLLRHNHISFIFLLKSAILEYMEHLPNPDIFSLWLIQYGSLALFFLLALGIIALPIPEETLMVISGVLMYNGYLRISPTILAAFAGSITGITVSYIVGKTAGHFFLYRYAPYFGVKEHHLQKAHDWFERFGTWALFIGYFIPGVRHFTGFIAGTTDLKYPRFALFAYCGAIVWASTFLAIGYIFGDYFLAMMEKIEIRVDDILTILLIAAGCFALYYLAKRLK